jgi:RNA polymerase sigma-70 factor, ECF subfamily
VGNVTLPPRLDRDAAQVPSQARSTDAAAPGGVSDMLAEARMRELYDLHAGPLYRYLMSLTFGQRQAAEDLMQETLLRAWRNLNSLSPDVGSIRPWLFTVARRIAIDASRARRARPAYSDDAQVGDLPAPEDSIERILTAETVRRALPRLSPEHRRVIVELYYHGRTASETAEIVGIPEGTVKSRAYHALRAMRAAIGAINGGAP